MTVLCVVKRRTIEAERDIHQPAIQKKADVTRKPAYVCFDGVRSVTPDCPASAFALSAGAWACQVIPARLDSSRSQNPGLQARRTALCALPTGVQCIGMSYTPQSDSNRGQRQGAQPEHLLEGL